MAYYTSGFEDVQNWPFSVRYTASPYRKSKFPVDSSSVSSSHNNNNANPPSGNSGNVTNGNGSSSASSTNSGSSNNSVDCNNSTSTTLRPHQILQHHQHHQQLAHQNQQQHHHLQQQQQWANNNATASSPAAAHHPHPHHHQLPYNYHPQFHGGGETMLPGSGVPFQLHIPTSNTSNSNQNNQNFNYNQQLFYHHHAQQQQQQQQYCSLNQVPSQQQSFFQPGSLPPDHHHYGLPPQQQQQQHDGKHQFFVRHHRNQGQYGFGVVGNQNGNSSSTPFSVDGIVLDEGYIEDLKQPHGLGPGNILLMNANNSDSANTANLKNGQQQQQLMHQHNSFDYGYNPYSYVYDSQILSSVAQQQQQQPLSMADDGSGSKFIGHGQGHRSGSTTIIERLQREAAAIQAAAAAAAASGSTNSSTMAHRSASASATINTSPSLSMKQSSVLVAAPIPSLDRHSRSSSGHDHGSRRSSFENEYEEISDVARYMTMMSPPNMNPNSANSPCPAPSSSSMLPPPLHFKSFSSTDDILAEVVQVQDHHDRVLDQLNLEVENLLIRSSSEIIIETNNAAMNNKQGAPAYHHRKGVSDSGLTSSTSTGSTMDDHCYCNLATPIGSTIVHNSGKYGQKSPTATATSSCLNGTGDYCCQHSIDSSTRTTTNHDGKSSSSCGIMETCGGPNCSSTYCSCCTASSNSAATASNMISGGCFYNNHQTNGHNMTFATNNNGNTCNNSVHSVSVSNRKKKLERIFGVTHSNSDPILKDKINYKLRQEQCAKSGIVKSNSTSFTSNNAGSSGANAAQPKHHRSYSIIPHWKIRDHLMRLPFLRQHNDKLKKSDTAGSLSISRSLQNSKKYKQESANSPIISNQEGHNQYQFQRDLQIKLRKNRNSYITTAAAGATVGGGAANMASVKLRSSSMDELRPTVVEEHWYSADSDTDPDSLTVLSSAAKQQQQQQPPVGCCPTEHGNGNAGSLSALGLGFNSILTANNNTNCNSMSQSSSTTTRRNSVEHVGCGSVNNGQTRHDIGAIPDAPKPPKFRRGPTTTGLKEKWRESWTQSKTLSKTSLEDDNRLLRWFSLRKNQGGIMMNNNSGGAGTGNGTSPTSDQASVMNGNHRNTSTLQALNEEDLKRLSFIEDEEGYWPRRTVQPPSLPPAPLELTSQQITRRHIVAAIVHTENNYVAALQRLVNEYKKPLEGSHPAILSHSKISSIFHRVPEILQCHSLFRIALAEYIRKWDTDEKIGDVFVASFSKSLVLDVYSEFINNFGTAMETAKLEARRKSVFAEYLKLKQITAHDRLSLFGLMVKPVQRFPQFILLLQDLLKQTPKDHHDRMSLQLALTQLESLAAMLNERKRESEQYQAFRETIKSISGGKFVLLRSVVDDPNRILLRQDIVTQLEFDSNGASVAKSKCRKLLLLNDLLICVSLNQSSSNNSQNGSHERNSNSASQLNQNNNNYNGKQESSSTSSSWGSNPAKGEKSVFKWSFRVQEVEVDDISISPTMSRLVPHSSGPNSKQLARSTSVIPSQPTPIESETQLSKSLLEEMQSLMYDYEVLSRILGLVSSLKSTYEGLNEASIKELMLEIQHQIRCRDEQISYFDSSCLTLLLGNPGSNNREKVVFQMNSPYERNEWIEELRLAQLALDKNNTPAWDIPTESPYPHHKLPLFVRALPLCRSPNLTTVKCGCFFTHTFVSPTGRSKILDYLWVSCTDGISSHITAFRSQQNTLKEVSSFDLMEERINDLLFVSGHVWIATENQKILIYDPSDPDQTKGSVNQQLLSASVVKLTLFENVIYAGLADGHLVIFTKIHDPLDIEPKTILKLGSDRISSLFGSREHIYASCGNNVVTVDVKTHTIERNVVLTHHNGPITHMACSGVGLWIAAGDSGTVCLYHLESLQHLQDVSIAPSVFRTVRDSYRRQKGCHVTCLTAHKGWLWIGTNLGCVLTIPLPRLEGVPIISTGKANVSYHGYYGPVTFLMPLMKPAQPVINTTKPQKSVQIVEVPRNEVISSKEFEHQQQLEKLEREANSPIETQNSEDVNEEDEDTKAKRSSLSLTPRLTNLEISPQTSISSGLSGSHDGSVNETLLAVGTTTPKSLSPSSSITAPSNKTLVVLRKKNSRDSVFTRNCKTLPRGGPIPSNLRFTIDSDVYGLYGNLINVRGLEDEGRFVDPLYDALRRSDPELVALDSKISTMDRRLKMRMSRPRSLDLSNWSVDSKISVSSDESSVGVGGGSSRLSGGSSSHTLENSNTTPPTTLARGSSNSDCVADATITATGTMTNQVPSAPTTSSTNTTPNHGGTSKKTAGRSKANTKSKSNQEKTIIVVVGGRGYVNMKSQPTQDHYLQQTSSGSHSSESDAKHCTHLSIWQMKA